MLLVSLLMQKLESCGPEDAGLAPTVRKLPTLTLSNFLLSPTTQKKSSASCLHCEDIVQRHAIEEASLCIMSQRPRSR